MRLSKTKVNERRMWCVAWPKIGKGRNRKFFTSTARRIEDDEGHRTAKAFFDAKKIEQQNYGTAAMAFDEKQRAEYFDCYENLKPYGKTLRDAVAFYLPHLKATSKPRTIAELVEELLRVKKADGASGRYVGDLRSRLRQFAEIFGGQQVADLTHTEVDDWLRSLAAPDGTPLAAITRNNFRRVLIVALNHAILKGYCVTNAAKNSAEAKETKLAAGILSVPQAAGLLSKAAERIVPAVALGLFAGLRPEAEGLHLDWSHIDFEDKTINIEPDKTKADSSARYIEMSENLILWLTSYRKDHGAVFPTLTEYYERLREARKAAGIEEWPHDALRHSYGSYHYGAHRNAAQTQAAMGHTNSKIFFKHYRKAMKQAVALPYWQIVPRKSPSVKK